MRKSYQPDRVLVREFTYSAGVQLETHVFKIPVAKGGRFVHVQALDFNVDATPTLSSGNVTAVELQNTIRAMIIKDKMGATLCNLGWRHLRLVEAMENQGRLNSAEPDDLATTQNASVSRRYNFGPPGFGGAPSDFVVPAPLLNDGSLEMLCGSLANITANLTAFTGTIRVYAVLALRDDVLLSPRYVRGRVPFSGSQAELTQEALYAYLAILNDDDCGALAAGDLNSVVITDARGENSAIQTEVLQTGFENDNATGTLSIVRGESRNITTDDNQKVINGTAAAATSAVIQPVIWSPPGTLMSKLVFEAKNSLKVRLEGNSQTTGVVLFGRFEPLDGQTRSEQRARCEEGYGVKLGGDEFSTLSKETYKGPRGRYMPIKCKAVR